MSRQNQKKQNGKAAVRFLLLAFVLAVSVASLSACGKKPSQIDPPVGAGDGSRSYPDIATDPRP